MKRSDTKNCSQTNETNGERTKSIRANDAISLRKLILKTRWKVINSIKVYDATA